MAFRLRSGWRGIGRHLRQWPGPAIGATQEVVQDSEWIAAERAPVGPPLAKGEFHVADGRATNRKLSVMPRRSRPVHRRHRLALPVAVVVFAVAPAVAEVDAPDKGEVVLGLFGVPDDDHFLVMRAAEPHPLVEQDLAAGGVDHFPEVAILLGAEAEAVEV